MGSIIMEEEVVVVHHKLGQMDKLRDILTEETEAMELNPQSLEQLPIYAGGGGGHTDGRYTNSPSTSSGGLGGGGNGGRYGGSSGLANAQNGTANLGGGGGSAYGNSTYGTIGSGGSGVVILKVPTASYSGTTTGSPTITTSGSFTIIKFTGSGTYTS